MDNVKYLEYLKRREDYYESLCKRCGMCCGAMDGDPCSNLRKGADGKYFCSDYANRIREHTTVRGKLFHCVPIRDIIKYTGAREGCAYMNLGINGVSLKKGG